MIRFWNIPWLSTHFGFLIGNKRGRAVAVPVLIEEHVHAEDYGVLNYIKNETRSQGMACVRIRLRTSNVGPSPAVERAIRLALMDIPKSVTVNANLSPSVSRSELNRLWFWFKTKFYQRV